MKNLIKKTYNQNKKLFENHKKVLLAVSTGIDSMVLLEYFLQLKDKFSIEEIGVFHVNHGLREQSLQEEKFIEKYCKEKNISIHICHFDNHNFSEQLAREFRYESAQKIMEEYGYSALVTAHHKDDQAETIFMRIIRGSRLLDIGGIKTVQSFGKGQLIRPFLQINKSELPDVFHFEDETNKENDYFRNRVRNIYIPSLTEENKEFSNHLVNLGKEVNSLNSALTELIKEIDYLNIKTFRSFSKDVQYYFIQNYIEKLRLQGREIIISKKTLDDVLNMLNNGKQYNNQKLNNKIFLVVTKEKWYFQ